MEHRSDVMKRGAMRAPHRSLLKADGLTTQLSVLELNSELYHLLAAGFYMFYLARLPHLLHGSLRKHLRLRGQHCVLLGNICRSQMPERIMATSRLICVRRKLPRLPPSGM